jgi:hypothetical protein
VEASTAAKRLEQWCVWTHNKLNENLSAEEEEEEEEEICESSEP